MDGDLLYFVTSDSNCGVGALCENDSPGSLCVLLGAVGDGLSNLLDILGLDVVRLGESGGLGLVTNEDVNVGKDFVERVLEELGNEGSGQVEDERLVFVSLRCSLSWPDV